MIVTDLRTNKEYFIDHSHIKKTQYKFSYTAIQQIASFILELPPCQVPLIKVFKNRNYNNCFLVQNESTQELWFVMFSEEAGINFLVYLNNVEEKKEGENVS